MLIGPVLVLLLVLLFYKRPVNVPAWTPPPQPPQPWPPQVGPQPGAPYAAHPAQGSAPIRSSTFAPPRAAPSSSAFAPPPDPSTIKPAPLPPPVDLNDVFRRPSA